MTTFQAIMFDKKIYTTEQARKFLTKHKFNPIKRVRITKNYHRYRSKEPDETKYIYRIKHLQPGVMAVVEI